MTLDFLKEFDFFTGVPDSLLSNLCSYLIETYGISKQHIIAANEGTPQLWPPATIWLPAKSPWSTCRTPVRATSLIPWPR